MPEAATSALKDPLGQLTQPEYSDTLPRAAVPYFPLAQLWQAVDSFTPAPAANSLHLPEGQAVHFSLLSTP